MLKSESIFIFLILTGIISSCASLKESPKYELKDGIYNASFLITKRDKVYIEMHEDTVQAYAVKKDKHGFAIANTEPVQSFPEITEEPIKESYILYKPSLDIDFVTIPAKYRPEASGFPRQLNSSLSGALYLGSRYDVYKIHYHKNPLGIKEREINHLGFSLGLFGGLGSTFMNPWVTNDAITSEYDGVVLMKGIAALAGFNNFTAGIAVGTDNLLDRNREFWIYEDELWVGLTFGLNLN